MPPKIVVISPHSDARASLIGMLEDQCAHTCESVGLDPTEVAAVHRHRPIAVVLDPLTAPDAVAQLAVSLDTLSPRPPIIHMSQTSGLRRDLDSTAEEELIEQLAMVIPSFRRLRHIMTAAADIIEAERRDIVGRWIQRLDQIPAFQRHPELSLRDLRDEVPLLMRALVDILRYGARASLFRPGADAYDGAVGHARMRVGQGIPVDSVVQEYQLLRNEIWLALRWHLTPRNPTVSEIFVLGERFNFTLDSILALTVNHYNRVAPPRAPHD